MAPVDAKDQGSYMLQTKPPRFKLLFSSSSPQKSIFMAQIMIRILAISFTVAAISVMASSSQSIVFAGFTFTARYTYSSAMKFLFGADVTVCCFSVLSLIFVCLVGNSGSELQTRFFLFLHDMMMLVLVVSGCAAATAVGYISKYGEEKVGWLAVCMHVEHFCNRMLVSLVMSYLALFSYFALAVMSTHKLMQHKSTQ